MNESRETSFWHPFAPMGQVKNKSLTLDRAEGIWVYDDAGNRYLDGTASLWYTNVGHGRESIVKAVHDQMAKMETYQTFGDFTNRAADDLANLLSDLSPMDGARIFLTSGGGDSIDTAAKLARRYWHEQGQPGRQHLITRTDGYHGTHGFGTSLAGIPPNRANYGDLIADVSVVDHGEVEMLEAEINRLGADRVAAFFMEPVIGAGGVYPPPPGYIEAVAKVCSETGVLLVVDSVICGFGRLGTWFGIERWPGVIPDMITFAKGVTSGYLPLGGVVVSGKIAEPFWGRPDAPAFRHGATYAGHAACCAAALENIRILDEEGLLTRGQELEGPLLEQVERSSGFDVVAEVRGGVGTMAALELSDDVLTAYPGAPGALVMAMRDRGVLGRPLGRGVALSPPLIIEPDELTLIGDVLHASVEDLATGRLDS